MINLSIIFNSISFIFTRRWWWWWYSFCHFLIRQSCHSIMGSSKFKKLINWKMRRVTCMFSYRPLIKKPFKRIVLLKSPKNDIKIVKWNLKSMRILFFILLNMRIKKKREKEKIDMLPYLKVSYDSKITFHIFQMSPF